MSELKVSIDPKEVGMSAERLARIDSHFKDYVDDGRLPGYHVAVARYGQIVHSSTYGMRDVEAKTPIEQDTMYRIYSMTKPITSIALMMMVEEGKVHLDDPISRYIPEFKGLTVAVPNGPAQGNAPPPFVTKAPAREITVKDLLTHVSGLASGTMSNSTVRSIARKEGEKLADYIPRLGRTTLEFEPGTQIGRAHV